MSCDMPTSVENVVSFEKVVDLDFLADDPPQTSSTNVYPAPLKRPTEYNDKASILPTSAQCTPGLQVFGADNSTWRYSSPLPPSSDDFQDLFPAAEYVDTDLSFSSPDTIFEDFWNRQRHLSTDTTPSATPDVNLPSVALYLESDRGPAIVRASTGHEFLQPPNMFFGASPQHTSSGPDSSHAGPAHRPTLRLPKGRAPRPKRDYHTASGLWLENIQQTIYPLPSVKGKRYCPICDVFGNPKTYLERHALKRHIRDVHTVPLAREMQKGELAPMEDAFLLIMLALEIECGRYKATVLDSHQESQYLLSSFRTSPLHAVGSKEYPAFRQELKKWCHKPETNSICSYCGKNYSRDFALDRHVMKLHRKENQVSPFREKMVTRGDAKKLQNAEDPPVDVLLRDEDENEEGHNVPDQEDYIQGSKSSGKRTRSPHTSSQPKKRSKLRSE